MSTLKWCAYSASNNKTIDDAYWAGETSIRIINGRRKYTIQFNSMVQVRLSTIAYLDANLDITKEYNMFYLYVEHFLNSFTRLMRNQEIVVLS